MISALAAARCNGALSYDDFEGSRGIVYGTAATEDGQPLTTMDLLVQLAFGTCDRPLEGRLNPSLRESADVVAGRYRKELLLDFTPRPQSMCAQLSLSEPSGVSYAPVEARVDVRMNPRHEPPDSARVDVLFRPL